MNRAAIILCGGRSRRMGRDKASLMLEGETLLNRMVRLAGSVVDAVVVVAAPAADQPWIDAPPGVAVVRDPIADRGPLQGIATGLGALPDRFELVYVAAVDAPFLDPAWIDYLTTVIGDVDAAAAFVEGRRHPLAALYRRSRALPVAQSLLQSGRLRATSLVESLRVRLVTEDEMARADPELRTLRNLNTPADYHQAVRDARRAGW